MNDCESCQCKLTDIITVNFISQSRLSAVLSQLGELSDFSSNTMNNTSLCLSTDISDLLDANCIDWRCCKLFSLRLSSSTQQQRIKCSLCFRFQGRYCNFIPKFKFTYTSLQMSLPHITCRHCFTGVSNAVTICLSNLKFHTTIDTQCAIYIDVTDNTIER